MTIQNRREFIGLALGGLLARAVGPILPPTIEPWYVRCARPDWTPSPIPAMAQSVTLRGFLERGVLK